MQTVTNPVKTALNSAFLVAPAVIVQKLRVVYVHIVAFVTTVPVIR